LIRNGSERVRSPIGWIPDGSEYIRSPSEWAQSRSNGPGEAPDAFGIARDAGRRELEGEEAGGVRQCAPGRTGYFTESGAGEAGAAVSGAGSFGVDFRERLRNGLIPYATSFSLSFP